ncbi:MAG TPA: DNA polymerase ligase N-terminal domain-containing protein [Solirubrobacteraceae bacterium]|jgi:DNA ligase D-like protein (predicted 3'-phosphoesterase)|nr:DNA polymerase ligase N-terminal domain-containing protein [Solirubrobacteraceae bacterium]
MASRRLETYRRKRDLNRSGEPAGGRRRPGRGPVFVIQKHHATSLHYDFRLEVAGVLRSWAVPKGPSTDPRDRRLAMEVEDHPLDYASFEGVIEEGSYGAGPVIVWDTGTYRNLSERRGQEVPIEQALRDGHVSVWLEGRKLRGGWSLRRIRSGAKPQWLLVKRRDPEADARRRPTSTQPESVLSGRTIEELVRSAGSGG